MWQNMTTAPKDGTIITMIGHIDAFTKKKHTYRGYFRNGYFITVGGWIIFPDKWKP